MVRDKLALGSAGRPRFDAARQEKRRRGRGLTDRNRPAGGCPHCLLVTQNPNDPPGSFRRGYFAVSYRTLTSPFRDAIVAHELGHYVLGHDAPLRGATLDEMERDYQQRELDANAKGVEILIRVAGFSEARALRTMYDYLAGVQWALDRRPSVPRVRFRSPSRRLVPPSHRIPTRKSGQF
jgi:hypothetical protein